MELHVFHQTLLTGGICVQSVASMANGKQDGFRFNLDPLPMAPASAVAEGCPSASQKPQQPASQSCDIDQQM